MSILLAEAADLPGFLGGKMKDAARYMHVHTIYRHGLGKSSEAVFGYF